MTSPRPPVTQPGLDIVILGLAITSSWGNGHATTYRALIKALVARGHRVLFLERDVPWYAAHRDLKDLPGARIALYRSMDELREKFGSDVGSADAVVVGSYVPEGVEVGDWVLSRARGVTAFYDIDTPVTLAKLRRGEREYLDRELLQRYQLYLSFTGGPTLEILEGELGAVMARPLYCSVDPDLYFPEAVERRWKLGFLGTYAADRQPGLQALLIEPAGQLPAEDFIVAGPQFPEEIRWPANVERIEHLPPQHHRRFYNQQEFTLNLTRADMVQAGYSPSVRLFEAAACGTPTISDAWAGLDHFLEPGREILVARSAEESLRWLRSMGQEEAREIGRAARTKVMAHHTAAHRAEELEGYLRECQRPKLRSPGRDALAAAV